MYGDIANKLIQDSKRSRALDSLPLYSNDSVQAIIKEINHIEKKIQEIQSGLSNDSQPNRVKQCQLFVLYLCLRRNKRILLSYQKTRCLYLNKISWENIQISNENNLLDNLSFNEQIYFKNYNDLITDYKNEFADIDLTGSLKPPNEVFIDVRVLKDVGEIQTEYGVFNLTKDSQFFVRYSDVEKLINQGYLQKL
ncbi:DNA replication protein PSF1 [Ascoidea rubescens DSM 1968]|uniref:DNA replication complex GINS protein PSF1 n=1 Tax=Ascoidea rubescens DSM 1968 TaxID=1344418 RepID=A0A1D2VRC9_9ASCO|nr:GINS complex, Psf1 component [Ascoidea rubescens DSM 1968]ODV64164.1 GINS complex, Psf1 component [Ascoidea rubescens DSM 1968]